MRKKLLQPVYTSHILIIIIAFSTIGWIASRQFRASYLEEAVSDLEARTRLITPYLSPSLISDVDSLNKLCKTLSQPTKTRITIILPTGKVACDTHEDPERMDNHGDRPEVMTAISEGIGSGIHHSYTLDEDRMYLALPLFDNQKLYGIVRTSIPLEGINKALNRFYLYMGLVLTVIATLSTLIFVLSSRRIRREIVELVDGAKRLTDGNFSNPILQPESEEMAELASTLNTMSQSLDEKIETITRQHNENDTILASMLDSVLAIDTNFRIINLNKQAKRMFDISDEVIGSSVIETVRNADLHKFVNEALSKSNVIEDEFSLIRQADERIIQVHATPLTDEKGNRHGVVIVLNDITKLRQLESSRQDFVANVSHELKTPITSISGFVETLLNGAKDDPKSLDHFLTIIAKQSKRLNALIDDLMDLARIERKSEENRIKFTAMSLKSVLQGALSQLNLIATEKQITLQLNAPEDVTLEIDPILIEQAVTNLIDNAIRHSNSNGIVAINLKDGTDVIEISVSDSGCGIAKEHLPRLFERFYRADPGRSRQSGGTGLGLSIVKHIAQAHSGKVAVTSTLGKGSTFTILLPKNTIQTIS